MMKIGIISFHSVNNYGAVWQVFCLQETLKARGHNVSIIDYRPEFIEQTKRFRRWDLSKKTIGNVITFLRNKRFERFREHFLERTKDSYYSFDDLASNAPVMDAYISGSDQVWNPTLIGLNKVDPAYYLGFGPPDAKRLSYAASFGSSEIDGKYYKEVGNLLRSFDGISVRERSGVDIVNEISGKQAEWLPDPVFLFKDYKSLIESEKKSAPYIFTYMVAQTPKNLKLLSNLQAIYKVPLLYTETLVRSFLSIPSRFCVPAPLKWLKYLDSAECVVSSSFHAIAFSIILKKNFVYLLPTDMEARQKAERILSLLTRLGLTDRIVNEADSDKAHAVLSRPINWQEVHSRVDFWRKEALRYFDHYGV